MHYTFTDVSHFFLARARNPFAQHDFVDYRLFDINRPPAEQGFTAGSFDVVCANVLHNALDIDDVLVMLDRLLAPGGSLVFVDATAVNHPLMISMEFKEGRHGFTDVRAQADELSGASSPMRNGTTHCAGQHSARCRVFSLRPSIPLGCSVSMCSGATQHLPPRRCGWQN